MGVTPGAGPTGAEPNRVNVDAALAVKPAESVEFNVVLGERAGFSLAAKSECNTLIGVGSGEVASTAKYNTCVGRGSGNGITTGGSNVCIGTGAGGEIGGGTNNVYIGAAAAKEEVAGSDNIFIGNEAGEKSKVSKTLIIANNSSTPLIQGVLSGTQTLGFFGATPVAKPVVNKGSTADALNTALKELGLIGGT